MNTKLACGAIAALLLLAPSIAQADVRAEAEANSLAAPVSGTFDGGTFQGQFQLEGFFIRSGALVGVGTLSGDLIDWGGNVLAAIQEHVEVPLTAAAATCLLLRLQLGPLDIAVRGITLHVGEIILQIVVPPGTLLGNLLCPMLR